MQGNSDVEPLREYVFMHIPKTGGTSIRKAVVTALQAKNYRMVCDYQNNPLDTPWLPGLERNGKAAMTVREHFPGREKLVLIGHFPVVRYLRVFHPQSFFCFLRDPFDLVYSAYNHHRKYAGYNENFETFISLPRHQNKQSKLTAPLKLSDFGFFGLLESIDDEIAELSQFLGTKLVVGLQNRGSYNTGKQEMKERWRDRFMELNREDYILYEYAVRLKQQQWRRAGRHPEAAGSKGQCIWTDRNRINGWATIDNGNKMATVKLLDGSNQTMAEMRADLFRGDLRRLGRVQHGVAGFSFQLPAGVDRAGIRVIVKETGQVLVPIGSRNAA